MENKETLMIRVIRICNELRAKKDGRNTFSNYNYFRPDDLLNLLNPLLLKYNIYTKFDLYLKESYYQAVLTLIDANGSESLNYVFDIQKATVKGANEAQNSGATMTYAKRYSLMNAFNIAENDNDFDSDEHAKRELEAQNKAKKQQERTLAEERLIRDNFISESLTNCKTRAELLAVWTDLSKSEQQYFQKLKDEVKTKLTE